MREVNAHVRPDHGVGELEALCLVSLAMLLVVLRRPDMVLAPQFWAEDAVVFYAQAELLGAKTLAAPFAGYFGLFPRLVALAGTQAPVRYLPLAYTAAALCFAGLALWCVARSTLATSRSVLVAMLGAVVLAPYSEEVWGSITNAHWLSALPILAACAPPRDRRSAVEQHLILPLFALTGPSSLVLLPAVFAAAAWRRDRWRFLTLAVIGAGAAATLWAMSFDARQYGAESLLDRTRALVAVLAGRRSAWIMALVALGVAVAGWSRWRRRDLVPAVYAVAALAFAAAFCISGPREALFAVPGAGGRYVFVPWIAVSWLVIEIALKARDRAAAVVGCVMCAVALWRFPMSPRPAIPWPADAHCLERQRACAVQVAPYAQPIVLPGRGP